MDFDIIVLGSGPGGYVTAIRASQLGFKTAIIEKESLGGVCLNWGCIPTKALLKSAQVFEYINHAEDFGISIKGATADFPAVIKRSRDVADGMSKGISYLMKKNNISVITGFGKLKKDNKVSVFFEGQEKDYTAKHIIIATGARSRELPNLPQDGKKVIGKLATQELRNSGAIRLTISKYYLPSGKSISEVGVTPDITIVENSDKFEINSKQDNQLNFAIKLLKG